MKKQIVLLIRNFNIGGPQKSLLALLDNIDYSKMDVTLYYVYGGGVLQSYVNKNVRLVQIDPLIQHMLLEKGHIRKSFMYFVKHGHIGMAIYAIYLLARKIVTNNSMNMLRQRMIKRYSEKLRFDETIFDFGAGVSDCIMTYILVDCVNSRVKYHWVRSDYSIMDLDHKIEAHYFKKIDGAFAVSTQCGEIFCSYYPFMKGKVHEFINYIPFHYYESIESEAECLFPYPGKKIISICRIDPLKGLEIAVAACRILIKRYNYTGFTWFVLGDGPSMGAVKDLIAKNNVADHFIMLGMKQNVFSILKECDLFVHPSRTEGRSNSVEEAKMCGLPIVLTRYETAVNQITDGVDGIICDIDGESLAKSIYELMNNPEKCLLFRENLRLRTSVEYNSISLIDDILAKPRYESK